jgi:sulfite reductase beta subunit-like hemoprotein
MTRGALGSVKSNLAFNLELLRVDVIGVDGCAKANAKHQVADVGLLGDQLNDARLRH